MAAEALHTVEMDSSTLEETLSGLDALELTPEGDISRRAKLWAATWPKALAVGGALLLWQAVVWAHLKPDYLLPGPGTVFHRLWEDLLHGGLLGSVGVTMRRAATGYGLAVVLGMAVGILVVRSSVARAAFGSLITGLQTMPSIAWFPFAILIFKLSENAILFVVLVGAAPAIANGLISGIDHIPPIMFKAGRVLGARRVKMWWYIMLPASLPGLAAGLKQGWAFAWRSLLAGELLVAIAGRNGLGTRLSYAQTNLDAPGLMSAMVTILVIGIAMDTLFFGRLERFVRVRWGLARQ
jgi:NitT/TauT family transport system permease protein